MERGERIRGALFGVACGDALGGTLEFTSKSKGEKLYGYHKEIIGGGAMHLKPGDITDDTIMTMAVAEGIIENPENPIEAIGRRFVDWYLTGPIDIGNTCSDAISKYIQSGSWEAASLYVDKITGGRTAGNGTLMRCIAPALFYRGYEKMISVTRAQSEMTHYDKQASEACTLYNTIIYKYLAGEDKEKAVLDTLKENKKYESVFQINKDELHPSGYVVDSFKCALWAFLNHSNVEDIICAAVNLYGDPDTIGAITGGLAGTYYGYNAIPERWRNKLIVKEKLMLISEKLNQD